MLCADASNLNGSFVVVRSGFRLGGESPFGRFAWVIAGDLRKPLCSWRADISLWEVSALPF